MCPDKPESGPPSASPMAIQSTPPLTAWRPPDSCSGRSPWRPCAVCPCMHGRPARRTRRTRRDTRRNGVDGPPLESPSPRRARWWARWRVDVGAPAAGPCTMHPMHRQRQLAVSRGTHVRATTVNHGSAHGGSAPQIRRNVHPGFCQAERTTDLPAIASCSDIALPLAAGSRRVVAHDGPGLA